MPYASQAQERFSHTQSGMKKMGPATVSEFDAASKGKNLPERAALVSAVRKRKQAIPVMQDTDKDAM